MVHRGRRRIKKFLTTDSIYDNLVKVIRDRPKTAGTYV